MLPAIDKLFKGYSIKEIEEILIKAGSAAAKTDNKPYRQVIKELPSREKRQWLM